MIPMRKLFIWERSSKSIAPAIQTELYGSAGTASKEMPGKLPVH